MRRWILNAGAWVPLVLCATWAILWSGCAGLAAGRERTMLIRLEGTGPLPSEGLVPLEVYLQRRGREPFLVFAGEVRVSSRGSVLLETPVADAVTVTSPTGTREPSPSATLQTAELDLREEAARFTVVGKTIGLEIGEEPIVVLDRIDADTVNKNDQPF